MNIRQSFMDEYPTIFTVSLAYGYKVAASWLTIQLHILNKSVNVKNKMTAEQINACSIGILGDGVLNKLKISEFMVFVHWLKTGKYGDIYGRLDTITITNKLRNEFLPDRMRMISSYEAVLERERHEKEIDEARKSAISAEEYFFLKDLAQNGNEKARKILNGSLKATRTDLESIFSSEMDNVSPNEKIVAQNENIIGLKSLGVLPNDTERI